MSSLRQVVTRPHHLAARFFGSLSKRPPSSDDETWAESYLLTGETRLWREQSNIDRRHCIKVARRFLAARPSATRAEMAGALLHDIGKIESKLSTIERVAASLVGPRTERFRSYLDHERIGSELARDAGSEMATVDLIAERGPAFDTLHECDRA